MRKINMTDTRKHSKRKKITLNKKKRTKQKKMIVWMRKKSKVCTIKILLHSNIDSGASASIVRKDVWYERHRILKLKRINGQLWQGPLILLS